MVEFLSLAIGSTDLRHSVIFDEIFVWMFHPEHISHSHFVSYRQTDTPVLRAVTFFWVCLQVG
jgi:hypothetical protein